MGFICELTPFFVFVLFPKRQSQSVTDVDTYSLHDLNYLKVAESNVFYIFIGMTSFTQRFKLHVQILSN